MKLNNIQYSIKYNRTIGIRRHINDIEDAFTKYSLTPYGIPIPDETAPDAPRIIINKDDSSSIQLLFSQISATVSIAKRSDNKDIDESVFLNLIKELNKLLPSIGISNYLYCGITQTFETSIEPKEYMSDHIPGIEHENVNLYDGSWQYSYVDSNKYFINQRAAMVKQYSDQDNSILPDLITFSGRTLEKESLFINIDINDRYDYLMNGNEKSLSKVSNNIDKFMDLLKQKEKEWDMELNND